MDDKTIYLIPGFMSPAWMMFPLQRYLGRRFRDVKRWDYPRVFSDLDATVDSLAVRLDRHTDGSVGIVAHSFGDWMVRSALCRVAGRSVSSLLSVCPVVTSVAAAKLATRVTGKLIPELKVMSNSEHSEIHIPRHLNVRRSFIWARGEMLIDRGDEIPPDARQQTVLASHNSVLFQPNAWKLIRDELEILL